MAAIGFALVLLGIVLFFSGLSGKSVVTAVRDVIAPDKAAR